MPLNLADLYTGILDTLDSYIHAKVEFWQYRDQRAPHAVVSEGLRLHDVLVEKVDQYARITLKRKRQMENKKQHAESRKKK